MPPTVPVRGGIAETFDESHVRDYADWGIFLGATNARTVEEGTTVELPPEGGSRRIVFEPVPEELIERFGRLRIASTTAEAITFQLSIWHEIATWFGFASVPGFSEKASAFSPEDLYSNLLGIKLARALARRRSGREENIYNSSVTQSGDLAGARALRESVLEGYERTLPEDHPSLLLARGNLAVSMSQAGDLAGARALREAGL